MKNVFSDVKSAYFVGIGGSGMFPLAQILKSWGVEISGSDTYESDTLQKVRALGVHVNTSHDKKNIENKNYDLVVYSAAINQDNPELVSAREKNIATMERSELLGAIFNSFENSIGISGTHGKTTTTSMISSILLDAQIDPTCVIGGTLPKINSNSCTGKSNIIVAEACEFVDSFLRMKPKISVITNIDNDHLDYFKNLDNLKNSFCKFASQTKNLLFINKDNKNTCDIVQNIKNNNLKIITFGLKNTNNKNNNTYDFCASNIKFDKNQCASFDIIHKNQVLCNINLKVPGEYNIYNSLAAFNVCYNLNININIIKDSLESFSGVHRRFEILSEINNITVIDDFAHHPEEIKNILNTARNMNFKKIWAIFQPHTYSRTYNLLNEFASSLSDSLFKTDKIIISEILAVREKNIYNITSEDLVKKIPQSTYIPTFDEITDYILKNVNPGDAVITLGGGNIYKCANLISEKLSNLYKT